jgi:hypothetical protein
VYEKSAVTDARGEARLVLPYSSERADLSQTSSWQIEGGDRTGTLRVREDDVREGRELSLTLE